MDQVESADVAARGEYERPWRRIAADLRTKIESGQWGPGYRLPTMADLQIEYGVSKNTVANALNLLRDEGLVVTRGRSLYVRADA